MPPLRLVQVLAAVAAAVVVWGARSARAADGPGTPGDVALPPLPDHVRQVSCPQGEAPGAALRWWEEVRARAEARIAAWEALRTVVEGAPAEATPQDPEALEPALLHAMSRQEAMAELEGWDCSEYPCIAILRSDDDFQFPQLTADLAEEPGWEGRVFGGMTVPIRGEWYQMVAVWDHGPVPGGDSTRVTLRCLKLAEQERRNP